MISLCSQPHLELVVILLPPPSSAGITGSFLLSQEGMGGVCSIHPQTLELGATIYRVDVNYCGEVGTSGAELLLGVPGMVLPLSLGSFQGCQSGAQKQHSTVGWRGSGPQPSVLPISDFLRNAFS